MKVQILSYQEQESAFLDALSDLSESVYLTGTVEADELPGINHRISI